MRRQILSFQSWLVDNILTGQRLDASFFYVMKQGVTYTVIPNSIKLIIIYFCTKAIELQNLGELIKF